MDNKQHDWLKYRKKDVRTEYLFQAFRRKMTKKKMLVGGQVKLDVAKPKGKLTAADFKELGNKGKMYGGKMKKPTKKMYGGSMKKPTKKMYGGKMHMNKKKGK